MKDTIVQEVREARAAVAADFDCDLGKFSAWAKAHTTAERKARHPLPTQPATPAKPTRRKTARAPVK
jgi:hypothetical protein